MREGKGSLNKEIIAMNTQRPVPVINVSVDCLTRRTYSIHGFVVSIPRSKQKLLLSGFVGSDFK